MHKFCLDVTCHPPPGDKLDENSQPIETATAHLKVSMLSKKLLAYGHTPPTYPTKVSNNSIVASNLADIVLPNSTQTSPNVCYDRMINI